MRRCFILSAVMLLAASVFGEERPFYSDAHGLENLSSPDPDATAKAVYDATAKTLMFYFDSETHEGEGAVFAIDSDGTCSWAEVLSTLTRATFTESFSRFRPTNCARWFCQAANNSTLTAIEGLQYLDTSEVTSMASMFERNGKLATIDVSHFNTAKVTDMSRMFYYVGSTTLDLSSFDTAKVTNMSSMFGYSGSLKTVYVSEGFTAAGVTKSGGMFTGAKRLLGGAGTVYDASAVDKTYARIDGGTSNPGYFTCKEESEEDPDDPPVVGHTHVWGDWVTNKVATATEAGQRYRECTAEGCTNPVARQTETIPATGGGGDPVDPPVPGAAAKAVFNADAKTLTFYYDELTHEGEGTVFAMTASTAPWTSSDAAKTATKAVFDTSFRDFRPTSTASWFAYFKSLSGIEGMENLVTSEVTNMYRMFYNCAIGVYDLTGFDTGKVTNMGQMFAYTGGNKLNLSSFATTNVTDMGQMFLHARFNAIAVSELWSTAKVTSTKGPFGSNQVGTSALTGGAGTMWVDPNNGIEYACVDNPPDHPGYFTYAKPGEKPQTLPVIESVTISAVATNGVTVNVSGKDLDSGFFKVEIYDNDWLLVLTSATVNGWGSVKVTGLNPASSYYARAVATNGESGKSATYEDVPFVTDVQKGIAWVTLKAVSVTVADDGASANVTATIDTCNIDGALSFKLNGVEAKGWPLSAASEGETFSGTVPLTPYARYSWILEASGEFAGVKAIDTASGEFVASIRELWVNVAFAGGAYDVSSGTVPEASESPKGVWTPGTGDISYAASQTTGVGNEVIVEGSLEAFAVDECAAVPSGVKAVFGFVAYDGALKPAVWAKGAWHSFGFRCFTPGDTVAYTLDFDFQAEIPCVKASVGTETSGWFEIDAAAKSLTGFVFDGSADLGDFRGWQYLTGAGGEIILRQPTISSASGSLILADGKFSVGLTDCVKDAWYTPFYSDTLENPDWTAGVGVQCKAEGESLALDVLADPAEEPSMFVKIVVSLEPIEPGAKLN